MVTTVSFSQLQKLIAFVLVFEFTMRGAMKIGSINYCQNNESRQSEKSWKLRYSALFIAVLSVNGGIRYWFSFLNCLFLWFHIIEVTFAFWVDSILAARSRFQPSYGFIFPSGWYYCIRFWCWHGKYQFTKTEVFIVF